VTHSLLLPELPASVTAAESAELAARLGTLARSGLPLEGGLRALAAELGRPRLAGVLRRLAVRLERGETLEAAVAQPDCRLPVTLRGLIVAGVRSGRLPEALDQFNMLSRRRQDLRRRIFITFAYPALLLGMIAGLMILCRIYVSDVFLQIFHDFGMKLPDITWLYFRYSGVVGWTMLTLAIVTLSVPLAATYLRWGSWPSLLASLLPLLGPVIRHERYAQFARLMATLLDAQVPLPDALRLVSAGMQDTLLGEQCRMASAAVEAGTPLTEALIEARFLDSLVCFVDWGQRQNALGDAFRSAAEMFEARTSTQTALLNMIVLPVAYLFIVTYIGITILAVLLPIIPVLSHLSGGGL